MNNILEELFRLEANYESLSLETDRLFIEEVRDLIVRLKDVDNERLREKVRDHEKFCYCSECIDVVQSYYR